MVKERIFYGYFNYDLCNKLNDVGFWASRRIENAFDAYVMPLTSDGPLNTGVQKGWKDTG